MFIILYTIHSETRTIRFLPRFQPKEGQRRTIWRCSPSPGSRWGPSPFPVINQRRHCTSSLVNKINVIQYGGREWKRSTCYVVFVFFIFSGVAGYEDPVLDGGVHRVNCTSTSPGSINLCHTYIYTDNFVIFLTSLLLGLFLSPTEFLCQCKRYMKGKNRKAFKTAFERKFLLKSLENVYTNGRSKSSCLEEASIYSLRWFFVSKLPLRHKRVKWKTIVVIVYSAKGHKNTAKSPSFRSFRQSPIVTTRYQVLLIEYWIPQVTPRWRIFKA